MRNKNVKYSKEEMPPKGKSASDMGYHVFEEITLATLRWCFIWVQNLVSYLFFFDADISAVFTRKVILVFFSDF